MFEKGPGPGVGAGDGYAVGNPNVSMADFIGKFSRAIMPKRPMEKKKLLVKEAMPILLEVEVRGESAGLLDDDAWCAHHLRD